MRLKSIQIKTSNAVYFKTSTSLLPLYSTSLPQEHLFPDCNSLIPCPISFGKYKVTFAGYNISMSDQDCEECENWQRIISIIITEERRCFSEAAFITFFFFDILLDRSALTPQIVARNLPAGKCIIARSCMPCHAM